MPDPALIASETELNPPPSPEPPLATGTPPIIGGRPTPKWYRLGWLILAVVLLAALGLLFGFNPAHHSFYPSCAFYRLTGLQCPGCGGLRAVHHLLHGDILTALRFNPLFVLALPVAAWFVVRRVWCGPSAKPFSHRTQARWAWLTLAVLVVFWIVRNLPLEIFKLPTE